MNQVKFLVTIFLLTLLAAKGQGDVVQNLNAVLGMVKMFNSPNHPNNYNSNLNCEWNITADVGCKVEVTFTIFQIEEHLDCVEINKGDNNPVSVCGPFAVVPKKFVSIGREFRIKFTSDESVEMIGFKANYTALCPDAGVWDHWGHWSECSLCCGNGTQTRMRNCTNPPCEGDSTESRECNTHPCTVNCTGLQVTADSPFEQDCRRFYRCQNDILTCPMCPVRFGIQEWYDPRIRQCNHPCAVNCTTACGIKPNANTRIVGGSEAPINGWPWQVRLVNRFICGGTLIGEYWVLTAAHCFDRDDSSILHATLGAHYLNYNNVSTEQIIQIQKVILHPDYNNVTFANDIALLKLAQPAVLNNAVGLACLPTGNVAPLEPGKQCYITGWGRTAENDPVSDVLLQASVPVISDMVCNQTYSGRIDESMLCAGQDNNTGVCRGDSGGPLVCEHSGKYFVEGITSWGFGCGSTQVYADVRNLINWILQTISH